MATIKTFRPRSFPGDTFVRIDLHRERNGKRQIVPMFGLWPKTNRRGARYYECDSTPRTFATITEAKTYAMEQAIAQGLTC